MRQRDSTGSKTLTCILSRFDPWHLTWDKPGMISECSQALNTEIYKNSVLINAIIYKFNFPRILIFNFNVIYNAYDNMHKIGADCVWSVAPYN